MRNTWTKKWMENADIYCVEYDGSQSKEAIQ